MLLLIVKAQTLQVFFSNHLYKSLKNYLTFAVPPAWIQEPEKEVDVIAGNALHIPCLASGSPKPNIAWKREVGK